MNQINTNEHYTAAEDTEQTVVQAQVPNAAAVEVALRADAAQAERPAPAQAAAQKSAAAAPAGNDPQPTLNSADMRRIATLLHNSPSPIATREDLAALQNRNTQLFSTLQSGLAALADKKAEQDRSELVARMDRLEESVNRMEAALRIELEPVIEKTVAAAVAEGQRKGQVGHGIRLAAVALIAGLVIGAVFSNVAGSAPASADVTSSNKTVFSSPNGGIDRNIKTVN
ncbi:hypothetical protein [Donghicola tyrosinivorans]|uniref:Uncharacterized protein n=1 Tax=Donghicola tyrosinivorans TaxID=1652492 RepID=A0A2T0WXU9_9RHOB|nr:hypothetical protein [Donghicola tyrosinivorans]PRY91497.1 hypothetical protein CLV74_10381 [Donghicola tyrosinivorans]